VNAAVFLLVTMRGRPAVGSRAVRGSAFLMRLNPGSGGRLCLAPKAGMWSRAKATHFPEGG